jgi:probable F420-dependent oxidoreductase
MKDVGQMWVFFLLKAAINKYTRYRKSKESMCMPRPFRFSVVIAAAASRTAFITLARRAEELGYSTLLVPDRTSTDLAVLPALAVAAQATTSLRVGSYVFCNDFRHPALLARDAATLDFLSGGRFELGLGAGVGPFDYQQLGLRFDEASTRVGRLEEALSVIKRFFIEERMNFAGKHYTITDIRGAPSPLQKPHPPILIGASGKRMLSFAAREADSISIMYRLPAQGISAPNEALNQQLTWVREAAGGRFASLELSQMAYVLAIEDGQAMSHFEDEGPLIPRIAMSAGQAVEHLLEQRERYGFSYIPVYGGAQMEHFAPVIAQLAGR